ncbi:MAG: class I SAM-dependent methyltransferase [Candidatus ainarchaeum sp.]|nr:class I SAM-dependent methyltransferase [Candidatus ainarchaeum sp.]
MPKEPQRKPIPRKHNLFLNNGIQRAHERLKEILLDPEQREILKSRISHFRKVDRRETGYPQWRGAGEGKRYGHRPIEDYYAFYYRRRGETRSLTFLDIVGSEIGKKGRVRVLDVGAGYGQALAELKREFGDKVETHALVLSTTHALKQAHQEGRVDKIYQAEISTFLPKQEYDVIVSFFGGTRYTTQRETALKKILHSLSVDGVAYIQFDLHDEDIELIPILKNFAKENPNFSIDQNTFYEAARIRRLR